MAQVTWNDLFSAGTLIDFSIHLWRARIRITAEDLGIEATTEVQKALSFGCHRLVQAEALEPINSIVHMFARDIAKHSLAFPMLEGVRFVPDTEVKTLQRKIDMHLREFKLAVEEFLEDYDKNMASMLDVIEPALYAAAKTPSAAAAALSRIIREYPDKAKIADKFRLEHTFFTISMPVSKDAANAAKDALPQVAKAVTGMVTHLRKELADKVETLLSLATKAKSGTSKVKDGFGDKSKRSALEVLEKVNRLNFFNDPILMQQTEILKRMLDSSECELSSVVRDLDLVKKSLESDIAIEKKLTGLGNRKLQLSEVS